MHRPWVCLVPVDRQPISLALITERPGIRHVKVFKRGKPGFAETYAKKFDLEIEPVDSPEPLLERVDVVICATNTNVEL